MRRSAAGPLLGTLLAGWLAAAPAVQVAPPSSPPADLAVFVPGSKDIPEWPVKGEAQRFSGDDLYIYINGGAEIYNEYGFRRVIAQDFEHKDGRGVTLEIYEMADPSAAFGIYSFQTSGAGNPTEFGTDGEIEEYYLRFWKGRYMVTVTGFDPSGTGQGRLLEGVLEVARAADARIKETAPRPEFCRALPSAWNRPGLKYLRGVLGLNNVHPFFPGDVFGFKEAAAVSIDGGRLFVFGYGSAAEARTRLDEIRKAMARSEAYRDVRIKADGFIEASDSKENKIVARIIEDKIGLVLSPRAVEIAEDLLSQIR